jgi:hypothetical protein
MSVNDSVNVGTLLVNAHVHLDLGGGVELAFELVSVSVNLDDHVGSKVALGNSGRSAEPFVFIKLNGDVTVVCGNEAEAIELVTNLADFFFDFVR